MKKFSLLSPHSFLFGKLTNHRWSSGEAPYMVPRSNLQQILLISSDFSFFFSEFHQNAIFLLLTTLRWRLRRRFAVVLGLFLLVFFAVCSLYATDLSLFVSFTFLVYIPPVRFHFLRWVSYCLFLLICWFWLVSLVMASSFCPWPFLSPPETEAPEVVTARFSLDLFYYFLCVFICARIWLFASMCILVGISGIWC